MMSHVRSALWTLPKYKSMGHNLNLDWFLSTAMARKVTFKLVSSLEKGFNRIVQGSAPSQKLQSNLSRL